MRRAIVIALFLAASVGIAVAMLAVGLADPETRDVRDRPRGERNAVASREPRPLPPLERKTYRSRPRRGDRSLFWPRSAPIEHGVPYRLDVPHCGLTWLVDFDGSFWDPVDPNGRAPNPPYFRNPDTGVVTVRSERHAVYVASDGRQITLLRRDGPKAARPCF